MIDDSVGATEAAVPTKCQLHRPQKFYGLINTNKFARWLLAVVPCRCRDRELAL